MASVDRKGLKSQNKHRRVLSPRVPRETRNKTVECKCCVQTTTHTVITFPRRRVSLHLSGIAFAIVATRSQHGQGRDTGRRLVSLRTLALALRCLLCRHRRRLCRLPRPTRELCRGRRLLRRLLSVGEATGVAVAALALVDIVPALLCSVAARPLGTLGANLLTLLPSLLVATWGLRGERGEAGRAKRRRLPRLLKLQQQ